MSEGVTFMARVRPTKTSAPRPRQKGVGIAAALAYEPAHDAAPRVVAAGRGPVAARIVAIAEANGVAVEENGDLAEILAALDLGQTIPIALYAAVAEIIAYLHRRPTRSAGAATAGDRR
jgi:flagellar biosynthesis protein